MTEIDIVMPCYNCAQWLDATIHSLLAQEDTPSWRLIVRDDASTDDTVARLAAWQSRLGDRMLVLKEKEGRNLGLVGNSSVLLAATEAPWVMTCDADDVWLPRRIATTLGALRQAEAQFGPRTPLVVCTDARVVNETGETLAASYWRWRRQNPRRISRPADVAMESVALSPTMTMNRTLLDLALPIPSVRAQDSWLALVAVTFGRLIALPEQLVLYRRHSGNLSYLRGPIGSSLIAGAWRILTARAAVRGRLHQILLEDAQQAAAFAKRFLGQLPSAVAADMSALGSLPQRGFFGRRATLLRHRLRFGSPIKTAGMWVLL